jgi:anion-transporting  ArsA/GET3 family ATPase
MIRKALGRRSDMPATVVFTGSPGSGISIAAAAAAFASASAGETTLLLSLGPAHSLEALTGAQLGVDPIEIAPRLDALALDPTVELTRVWERYRAQLPGQLARLAADELPLLPGVAVLFGLLRLHELADRYQRVVLDAGPHDTLIQTLMLPDTLRWLVRLLIGLDRGPGRSGASQAQALLPSGFLPSGIVNGAQDTRLEAERVRALLTAPGATSARFVLRPDAAALADARLALSALQLYGLSVAGRVVGPLLPAGSGFYAGIQRQIFAEARAVWQTRPVLALDAPDVAGLEGLRQLAEALGMSADQPQAQAPLAESYQGTPALVVDLPGLPKGMLALTLSGDELVVRVGHYRRHILLPSGLRGTSSIRAVREGELLIVRRRE